MTQTFDLARLEALLSDLRTAADTPSEIIREHLQSARLHLISAKTDEYSTSLQLARQMLSRMPDEDLQLRVYGFIESQCRRLESRSESLAGSRN